MIVECDHCHAKYHYDEERFAREAVQEAALLALPDDLRGLQHAGLRSRSRRFGRRSQPDETQIRKAATRRTRSPRRAAPGTDESRRRSASSSCRPTLKLSLAVIAGPDAGKMFAIEKPRVVIGREEVDLVLDDPEISRQHAALEVRAERVRPARPGLDQRHVRRTRARSAKSPIENQGEFTVGGSTIMLIVTPL